VFTLYSSVKTKSNYYIVLGTVSQWNWSCVNS
jgi:hypothetical protein